MNNRKLLIKYLVTTLLCSAVTVGYILSQGLSGKNQIIKYKILADGFTIPALLLGSFGLLMIIADTGTLDGVVFGMMSAFQMLSFQIFSKGKPISYADFKEQREEIREKRRDNGGGFGYMLVVSGVFLLIALYFVHFFYKVYV